jgi:hypothetical protein
VISRWSITWTTLVHHQLIAWCAPPTRTKPKTKRVAHTQTSKLHTHVNRSEFKSDYKKKTKSPFPSSFVFPTTRAAPRPLRPLPPPPRRSLLPLMSSHAHAAATPPTVTCPGCPLRWLLPDAAVSHHSRLHRNCRPCLHQNCRPHQRQKHQRWWSTVCHSWPPWSPSRAAGTGAAGAQMVTIEGVSMCHP